MSDSPLKRCSKGEQCVHPDGCWQPADEEHFHHDKSSDDGYYGQCKLCANRIRTARYKQSPEKYKARSARYRKDKPEKVKESKRVHRIQNAERYRRLNRDYYKANADRLRNYQRQYRILNPNKLTSYAANRRARVVAASGTFTAADIQAQRKAQTDKKGRLRCWWCGQPIRDNHYHVDHRIPLAQGGSNAPENLCLACPSCNLSKGSKMPWEWRDRLL